MDKPPVDFICIPVAVGPGKSTDMWIRAEEVLAFQPAQANPLGVRAYIRLKHSADMIPTTEPCNALLAQMRGEELAVPENIVLFPGAGGQKRFKPLAQPEPLRPPPVRNMADLLAMLGPVVSGPGEPPGDDDDDDDPNGDGHPLIPA